MTDSAGQAILAAWRAAGSPPRVVLAVNTDGDPAPFLHGPWKRDRTIVPATPEQAAAWRAWRALRSQLRRAGNVAGT